MNKKEMCVSEFFCIIKDYLEEKMKNETRETILEASGFITHQAIILLNDKIAQRDSEWRDNIKRR